MQSNRRNQASRYRLSNPLAIIAALSLNLLLVSFVLDRCEYNNDYDNKLKLVIPPMGDRGEIGDLLQHENFKIGVELGVQSGEFSKSVLAKWSICEKYVLVDLWKPLENYADSANVDQNRHDRRFAKLMERMENYKNKIEICRNYTTICAQNYPSDYFDFVYVDARHDYKGISVDLHDWWPKLRMGGIMAGHDFVEQSEGPQQTNQNWTINYDGTIDRSGRAVKGAVSDFFNDPNRFERYRQITVTYKENGWWTWLVRK